MQWFLEWKVVIVLTLLLIDILMWLKLYRMTSNQRVWPIIQYKEPYIIGPIHFPKDRCAHDPPLHTLNGLLTLSESYRDIIRNCQYTNLAYVVVVIDNLHIEDNPMYLVMWKTDNAIIPQFHDQMNRLTKEYINRHGITQSFIIIRSGLCPIEPLLKEEVLNVSQHGLFLPWIFHFN